MSTVSNSVVCVAILNYNGEEILKKYLPSVVEHCPAYAHILVIDNNSSDQSTSYLRENYPEIELITHSKNLGFAGGYNEGLKDVGSDFLFLLNSDVELAEGCIETLYEYAKEHPECAALQPKVLSFEERNKFEYAGAAGGFLDNLGIPFCRGRIMDTVELDEGQYDQNCEVFWASGAAMFIRNSDFKTFGGFDADFFAHQEEIDLCWRIKSSGRSIVAIPSAVVYHLGGGTLDYQSTRKTFLNHRNSLSMLIKNESGSKVWWKFFTRLLLDGLGGLFHLLKGKPQHTLAVIRAHFALYARFGKLLRTRRQVAELVEKELAGKPGKSELRGKVKRNLIWDYFVLGRKTFSAIHKKTT